MSVGDDEICVIKKSVMKLLFTSINAKSQTPKESWSYFAITTMKQKERKLDPYNWINAKKRNIETFFLWICSRFIVLYLVNFTLFFFGMFALISIHPYSALLHGISFYSPCLCKCTDNFMFLLVENIKYKVWCPLIFFFQSNTTD